MGAGLRALCMHDAEAILHGTASDNIDISFIYEKARPIIESQGTVHSALYVCCNNNPLWTVPPAMACRPLPLLTYSNY